MRRIPKTRYPWNLERNYNSVLAKSIKQYKQAVDHSFNEEIKPILQRENAYYDSGVYVVDDTMDDLKHILELLFAWIIGINTDTKAEADATMFVNSISSASKIMVEQQVSIGPHLLPNIQETPDINNFIQGKIKENASLIKNIRDNYMSKIQQDIYRSVTNHESATQLHKALNKEANMSYNRAKLIAVDQTGSIHGQLNVKRQHANGFDWYEWDTMEDERVRPSHAALDRTAHKYDGSDIDIIPGEEIRCRCVATPLEDFDGSQGDVVN